MARERTSFRDALAWVAERGDAVAARHYLGLFWPQFTQIDGLVFIDGTTPTTDRGALETVWDRYGGNPIKIQQAFNFFEASDLLGARIGLSDDEEDELLRTIAEAWRSALALQFPGRRFCVDLVVPSESEGHDVGIVFFEQTATDLTEDR